MPAAAVIPAPIAYIKVAAVETLVVECLLDETKLSIRYVSVFDSCVLSCALLMERRCQRSYFE